MGALRVGPDGRHAFSAYLSGNTPASLDPKNSVIGGRSSSKPGTTSSRVEEKRKRRVNVGKDKKRQHFPYKSFVK